MHHERLRSLRSLAAILLLVAFLPWGTAQAPVKPPPLPPIAPAQARLDQTVNGLDGPGFAIACNEEAGLVVAACEHGTFQCWHQDVFLGIRTGSSTANVLYGHQGPVISLAWNGGPVLASAGADHKVILWSMMEGKVLHTLPVGGVVRALAMVPGGKVLASAGDDPAIQLWDVAAGKPGAKLTGHTDWVLCLTFSPDGSLLASGGYDGIVRLWKVADGSKVLDLPVLVPSAKPPVEPNSPVWAVAFSPDGKELALGSADGQIRLVNVADGKLLRALPGHTSTVTALAYHPSGTVLVSGSKDRTLRLWTPANGQAIKVLEGHTAWVQGVVLLAQGTRLASVGADQTVRFWDLTEPPKK
jgi:WD40 repeat protein